MPERDDERRRADRAADPRTQAETELAKGASVRDVAQQTGLSKSAVGRLRKRLAARFKRLQDLGDSARRGELLADLGRIRAETVRVYKATMEQQDYRTALRSLARCERQWQMLVLLLGQSGSGEHPIIDVTPTTTTSDARRILEALQDHPAALAAVLDAIADVSEPLK